MNEDDGSLRRTRKITGKFVGDPEIQLVKVLEMFDKFYESEEVAGIVKSILKSSLKLDASK